MLGIGNKKETFKCIHDKALKGHQNWEGNEQMYRKDYEGHHTYAYTSCCNSLVIQVVQETSICVVGGVEVR